MTVCTASMFVWNYAIPGAAVVDLGYAVITASDRKLTDSGLGIGYQGSRYKGLVLPNKQVVLVSGDMPINSTIIRERQLSP